MAGLKSKRTVVAVAESSLETFSELREKLGGLTNLEAFLIAMAWGFRHGQREENFKRSNNGPRIEYINKDQTALALLAAVHYATVHDIDSFLDHEQRLDIAEQYAQGGLLLLRQQLDAPGSFSRWFAGEIRSLLQERTQDNPGST